MGHGDRAAPVGNGDGGRHHCQMAEKRGRLGGRRGSRSLRWRRPRSRRSLSPPPPVSWSTSWWLRAPSYPYGACWPSSPTPAKRCRVRQRPPLNPPPSQGGAGGVSAPSRQGAPGPAAAPRVDSPGDISSCPRRGQGSGGPGGPPCGTGAGSRPWPGPWDGSQGKDPNRGRGTGG